MKKEGEEERKSPRIGDKKMRRGQRGNRREYREGSSMRSEDRRGLSGLSLTDLCDNERL